MVEVHNIFMSFNNNKILFLIHTPPRKGFTFLQNPAVIMIFLPKTNFKPHIVLIRYKIIVQSNLQHPDLQVPESSLNRATFL